MPEIEARTVELHVTDTHITPQDILSFFKIYRTNMDRYLSYEKKLFEPMICDDWLRSYRERSAAIRNFYEDNITILNRLNRLWSAYDDLPDTMADAFFEGLQSLDVSRYDDPFYAVGLLQRLIPHYEKRNDMARLLHLYNRLGWESCARIRMGYDQDPGLPLKAYTSILNYQEKYTEIEDPDLRRIFFVAYYNIIAVLPGLGCIPLEDTCAYVTGMEELYNDPAVRELEADNERIDSLMALTQSNWLAFESDLDHTDEAFRTVFSEVARNNYERQLAAAGGDVMKVSVESVLAHQHLLYLDGKQNRMDTILYLLDYYETRHARLSGHWTDASEGIGEEYYFETRVPDALLFQWLNHEEVPDDFRKQTQAKLIQMKNDFFSGITRTAYAPFINASISTWCFSVLPYLSSREEKENMILDMVINRQIATFFHSHVVRALTLMFMNEILTRRPELLCGFRGVRTPEEACRRKDELLAFAGQSALFHDVGKNKITGIITMQYRPLTDEEFYLIRKHPQLGMDALDDDFREYRDVILGHHKTHDGHSGYPSDFDNIHSDEQILIDIISICDTLDAGTDYLGRNYARQKNLAQVLHEIKAESGTRYNGDLVELIASSPSFMKRLNLFLTVNRERQYYDMFEKHFRGKWNDRR